MQIKKTKIVATIGPSSCDPQIMEKLLIAGVDVARLNFSHPIKVEWIHNLRSIAWKLQKPLAILADMAGPKLRLGEIEGIFKIETGKTYNFSITAGENIIPIQYDFSSYIKPSQKIYLNDGLVSLTVEKVENQIITAVANNDGWVSSHKGINLPDTSLPGAAFTKVDEENARFALKEGVDFLAISFIERADDLIPVKKLISEINPKVKIVVKIERKEAIKNLDEIVAATDIVMVARGDLATETSPAEVPVITQQIIRMCRQHQKPVIVATQMLETMTDNPRPTRAEASDVANAVLIQADAVMLSGETASGKYPVETVQTMNDIILTVERSPQFQHYIRIDWDNMPKDNKNFNALLSAGATMAFRTGAPVIAVGTASGRSARMISSFRPNAILLCATHDEQTKNQANLLWGSYPIVIDPNESGEKFSETVISYIRQSKLAQEGESVVFIGGAKNIGVSGATDMIKLVRI